VVESIFGCALVKTIICILSLLASISATEVRLENPNEINTFEDKLNKSPQTIGLFQKVISALLWYQLKEDMDKATVTKVSIISPIIQDAHQKNSSFQALITLSVKNKKDYTLNAHITLPDSGKIEDMKFERIGLGDCRVPVRTFYSMKHYFYGFIQSRGLHPSYFPNELVLLVRNIKPDGTLQEWQLSYKGKNIPLTVTLEPTKDDMWKFNIEEKERKAL
jgi:hypothetical protein